MDRAKLIPTLTPDPGDSEVTVKICPPPDNPIESPINTWLGSEYECCRENHDSVPAAVVLAEVPPAEMIMDDPDMLNTNDVYDKMYPAGRLEVDSIGEDGNGTVDGYMRRIWLGVENTVELFLKPINIPDAPFKKGLNCRAIS